MAVRAAASRGFFAREGTVGGLQVSLHILVCCHVRGLSVHCAFMHGSITAAALLHGSHCCDMLPCISVLVGASPGVRWAGCGARARAARPAPWPWRCRQVASGRRQHCLSELTEGWY